MKRVVFDTETSNIFADVGKNDPSLLDLSVISIYDYDADRYSSYEKEELSKLWPILEKADILIGFNSDHFDIPLLNKYYPGDLSRIKSLDLMKAIKDSIGRRIGLDAIAQATLGIGKSGHGLQAIEWWREGKKDQVKKYCEQDVKVTKELYEYALKHKHFKAKDGLNTIEIKLDTTGWDEAKESGMTFSLPF